MGYQGHGEGTHEPTTVHERAVEDARRILDATSGLIRENDPRAMAIIGATQESTDAVLRQLDLASTFLDQVLGIMAVPPTRLSAVTEYGAHIMSLETSQGSLELIMPVGLTVLRIRTFLPEQLDPEFSVAAWTDDRSSNSGLEHSSRQGMRNPDTPLPVSPVTLAHIVAHFAGEDAELSASPMGLWAIGYLSDHGQYPDPDQI